MSYYCGLHVQDINFWVDICTANIFPSLWLAYSFSSWCLVMTENFSIDEVQFINSFSLTVSALLCPVQEVSVYPKVTVYVTLKKLYDSGF